MSGQKQYWDENLDPQNLEGCAEFELETELAFLRSPEQLYAWQCLEPLRGRLILEIGTGLGVNAIALARQGAIMIALDLSGERLLALKLLLERNGLTGQVLLVQGSAEALPFASASLDRVYTKSVLIHTQLEQAARQMQRSLKPDGRGVFIEPLTGNPLVNLYRALFAPKIWRTIARYFGPAETSVIQAVFPGLRYRDFYCISFVAFCFQYAMRNVPLYRLSLKLLHPLDCALFQLIPPLRRLAWMRVFVAEPAHLPENEIKQ